MLQLTYVLQRMTMICRIDSHLMYVPTVEAWHWLLHILWFVHSCDSILFNMANAWDIYSFISCCSS